MFLVNYLITEGGFDDYNSDMSNPDMNTDEQNPPKIEHSDIKKFILYEQVKQIYRTLNQLQFKHVDDEFHSILNFCQNIIDFFNDFEYPEAVRLIDNLIDSIEEKLGLKLEKRIPYEFPEDLNPQPEVDPNQQNMVAPGSAPPAPAPPAPVIGNTPIQTTLQNQFKNPAKQG